MALNKTGLNNVVSALINEARNAYRNRNGVVMALSEAQKKHVLAESQESKSISAAKKLLADRLGYDEQQADEFVRVKLRNDLPVLRTPQGGKFILGVTRMFINGQLRFANDISNLNSTLKLVASDAHINEYDRNLNGLSCSELIERFSQARTANLEAEKEEVNAMAFNGGSQYDIVRIDSFEQARKYGDYTSWCVTHDKHLFNSYASNGINQFYFCLRHGFENVEKVAGEGCPLDEYGLSMIAVCVNEEGALNTCTCRWNHDNGGNDSIMSAIEISRVVGANFFNTFKPNGKWQEVLNTALSRLQNGEAPEEVFDGVGDFEEGFVYVRLGGKWNFLTRNGKLLSQQWFDEVDNFSKGFARVSLNYKWNFINRNGDLVSQKWFDWVSFFHEGFARVELNDKDNFINREGKVLSRLWFDWVSDFHEGLAGVELNDKWNFINCEGKYLSQKWFDWVSDFHEGFVKVELKHKWMYLDRNGKLWDKRPAFQEGMKRKRRTIMLSEAQMKDLILEAMSVDDIYQKYYSDIPEDVYRAVVTQADPTYNPQKPDKMGVYTKWLLGMVRKGTFKPGDIKEAHNLLTVFNKFKNKLQVKDVTQLHNMRELYDVVKPFMGQQTNAEKKSTIKQNDVDVAFDDGKWLVIIPHTEEAAKLYGKGTKWCTAADNDNMFDYYYEEGLLYILIDRQNNRKYQVHIESEQFMDEQDNYVQTPRFNSIGAPQDLVDFFRSMFDGDDIAYFMNLQWGANWEGTSHDNLFKVYFGASDFNLYDVESNRLIFDTHLNKSGYISLHNTCEYLYSKEKGYKILTDNGEIIPQNEWLRGLGKEHEGLLPVTKQNREENYLIVCDYPQDKIGTYLFKDDLAYAGEFDNNGFAIAETEVNKKLAIVSDYGEIFPKNFPNEYFEKVNRTHENPPFEVFYNNEWYLMDADGNLEIESDE